MDSDIELLTAEEVLRQQMALNKRQLDYLQNLVATELLVTWGLQMGIAALIFAIGSIVGFLVVPQTRVSFTPTFYDLGGVFVVFLISSLILTVQRLIARRVRLHELRYLCSQQEAALAAGSMALDSNPPSKSFDYE